MQIFTFVIEVIICMQKKTFFWRFKLQFCEVHALVGMHVLIDACRMHFLLIVRVI